MCKVTFISNEHGGDSSKLIIHYSILEYIVNNMARVVLNTTMKSELYIQDMRREMNIVFYEKKTLCKLG